MNIMISSILLIIITSLIMGLASELSKKAQKDREKLSPFECGFDPFTSPRLPFSLRFYLIAIIFLIFDIEIAIILPMSLTITNSSPLIWLMTAMGFFLILLLGLYHEWNQGALQWSP
nr:NADH dehydrogenase subunit 3 [Systropus sp. 2 YXA-2022a]